jgi:TolB-like protein
MRFVVVVFLCGLFSASLTGCASIMGGHHQVVPIESTPFGATVTVNDKEYGKTPILLALKRGQAQKIKIQAPGYFPRTFELKNELSGWYYMNPIFPLPLVGILGMPIDRYNGAAWSLVPARISISLTPYERVGIQVDMPDEAVPNMPPRRFARRNVAVAPLEALGVANNEALTLTETLRDVLIRSDYFTIVSRSDMDQILREQSFQSSQSCLDTRCLVEMGKMLAVEKIVGGSVGRIGDTYSLSLRMIDVESGEIDVSVLRNVSGKVDRLLSAISTLGAELATQYANRSQSK